jgi:multimeric flavodoxin WrbA
MTLKVLGISASPRLNGNSDTLLARALEGARAAGAVIETIHVYDYTLLPCTACGRCRSEGICPVEDDFNMLLDKILQADRLIFATPVFWMNVPAQAKALIDRTQCLWQLKYVLKQPIPETQGRDRRAAAIVVGGSKGKKMFECIYLTLRYWLDVLDMNYVANLFVAKTDARTDAAANTDAMRHAYDMGAALITNELPPPDKPINIELF